MSRKRRKSWTPEPWYWVEDVYLNRMDGDGVLETLYRHLAVQEWTDSDRVRLAFAFHMRVVKRTRDAAFSEIVELVQRLPDKDEQNYVAALILGFSGRILTDEQMERLKGVLSMTDLLKAIEQEALEKDLQQGAAGCRTDV